jgi:putative hydrolase of the HAD superfamily
MIRAASHGNLGALDRNLGAVGFDLDYTLWDQGAFFATFFEAAACDFGRRLGCGRRRFQEVCAGALERLTPAHPALFDRILHQLGAWDPRLVMELVDRFHRHRPPAEPYPGVAQVLGQLREAGLRLFLVTDGHPEVQRHKLAALGLGAWFDPAVFTLELPGRPAKPSPAPFRAVCVRMEVAPERCLYVGDNPACDFQGARDLGMLTAQVPTGPFAGRDAPEDCRAHLRLDSLAQLAGLLTADVVSRLRRDTTWGSREGVERALRAEGPPSSAEVAS